MCGHGSHTRPTSVGSDRPAETLKGPPAQPLGPSGVLLRTVGQEGPQTPPRMWGQGREKQAAGLK